MTAAVYQCNYCDCPHEDSTRSLEHVVPKAWGNRDLTLPDACSYWNNLFAQSFEKQVTASEFVRVVLREFGLDSVPKKGAHLLDMLRTARGTTEYLWSVDGREMLRDIPQPRKKAQSLTVELLDDLGRPHEIEVPLPPDCHYTYAAEGDDLTLPEVKKRIEKEHARVLEYLNRLARDPSFAPQVVEQLHKHGVRFHGGPMGISILTKEDCSPPQMVSDVVTKDYPMDVVRWRKQYLKIAWCFACRHLGRRALQRMGGDAVLDYLKRDRIDQVLVDLCRSTDREAADAVFDEVTVGGTLACLWKTSIAETAALAARFGAEVEPFVKLALVVRSLGDTQAGGWVTLARPGRIAREPAPPSDESRVHVLRLERVERGGFVQLVCTITLFGGVLEGSVHLTPPMPAGALPDVDPYEHTTKF